MAEQRTIVITGASDGIGAAAARQLTAQGHDVVLVGRSPDKTERLAEELGRPYHLADFVEFDQVRRLARELLDAYPRIDVLANNAGGMFRPQTSPDGFDYTLQINHLSPFLLTTLLLDRLIASNAAVVQTSSAMARGGRIDVAEFGTAGRRGEARTYSDSKLANILFSNELHRRYHEQGLSAAAFHPGAVASNFGAGASALVRYSYQLPLMKLFLVSPDKGGARLTFLAAGTPGETWQSGAYYVQSRPAKPVNSQAADPGLARALWERTEELIPTP
ncbi:short-chain dehydrogenase [Actinocatenispora thailandica]|uniref:Short-chain dehydrogenase n=1 Tax=Actinocatenispora thailandica TaxID=227318 RepID=A0A7R7DKW3_9ACTN|nr:SDR family NAD(P)-dependent oxidoreductase [Actinocatenispora thailandica]BCJ33478.1 short-chain dehydrogenase [Actinocatenispora thailandica]